MTCTDDGSSVVLADGEVVQVRPLRPSDAGAVLVLHEGLAGQQAA